MPILKDRPLRVDIETPRTAFRYYKSVPCGFAKMFKCKKEVIEYDFDLTKKADRIKFNEMGFECSVPNSK